MLKIIYGSVLWFRLLSKRLGVVSLLLCYTNKMIRAQEDQWQIKCLLSTLYRNFVPVFVIWRGLSTLCAASLNSWVYVGMWNSCFGLQPALSVCTIRDWYRMQKATRNNRVALIALPFCKHYAPGYDPTGRLELISLPELIRMTVIHHRRDYHFLTLAQIDA